MKNIIEFRNEELATLANFLGDIKLKNKASRGRTKLVKLLAEKNQDYQEGLDELRHEYFVEDENGNLKITKEQGKEVYVYKNLSKKSEHVEEVADLSSEKAVIDITEYEHQLKNLYKSLDELDDSLNQQDAVAYDRLMDELDACFIDNGKGE